MLKFCLGSWGNWICLWKNDRQMLLTTEIPRPIQDVPKLKMVAFATVLNESTVLTCPVLMLFLRNLLLAAGRRMLSQPGKKKKPGESSFPLGSSSNCISLWFLTSSPSHTKHFCLLLHMHAWANMQRYLHLEVEVWSRGIWVLLSSRAAAGDSPWFCFNAKYENFQDAWCLFSRPYIQHIIPHFLKPFLLQERWGVNSPQCWGALDPQVLTPTVAQFIRRGYLVFL